VYNSRRVADPPVRTLRGVVQGLSGGRGNVRMAWRAHADDEEFDEA
jgi:hypothetical protein